MATLTSGSSDPFHAYSIPQRESAAPQIGEEHRENLRQIIDRAVGLSPLQFGMSLQVAQDVAAREDSLESAIRDNR